jgi:hypothetical protein
MQSNTSSKSTVPSLLRDGEPRPEFALACLHAVRRAIHRGGLLKRVSSANQLPGAARLNCPRDYDGNCNTTSVELQA